MNLRTPNQYSNQESPGIPGL